MAASFDVSVTGDYSTGGGSVSTAINDFIRIPANLTAARFLTINLSLTGGFNEFCSSGLGCQFDNDVWSSADVGDDSHSFVSLSERVNLMSGQSHPYAVPPLNTWIVPIYPGFQNYFSYGLDISGGMSCIAAQSCDGFAQASYSDPPVIQILDTNMNVISGATIESELGIDYSRTSTVSTPEPARTEWVGLSIFALLLYRKKRSQARHSMAA